MTVLEAFPWVSECFEGLRPEGVFYRARCPLRDHRSGNLAVKLWLGTEGCLLFTCYPGCSKLEMLRAVGKSWKDCWPGGEMPDKPKQDVVGIYDYCTPLGVLLYQTLRLEPGRFGRDKEFRQRRPVKGDGRRGTEWAYNLDGVTKVLYGLPRLAIKPAEPVFVVAGEKDADSLNGIGLVATTNVCGEKSAWLESYSEALAGRCVYVVEDRDRTGRRHADEVLGSLMGHAASVSRVRLPAKDATAYLNQMRAAGVADDELPHLWWGHVKDAAVWRPEVRECREQDRSRTPAA